MLEFEKKQLLENTVEILNLTKEISNYCTFDKSLEVIKLALLFEIASKLNDIESSLAPHGESMMFRIDMQSDGIVFDGFCDLKADDVLNVKKGTRNKPSVSKDEAIECLNELIGEKGFAKLDDVKQLQEELGCSPRTMQRAKKDLQLNHVSIGFSKDKITYWIAPEIDKQKFKEQKEKELLESFELIGDELI